MSTQLLQGEKIAKRILEDVRKQAQGKQLKLAVIQVGKNAVSETYIQRKQKVAKEIGVGFELFYFPEDISQTKATEQIQTVAQDSDVSGVIVQLPLPKALNTQQVLDSIPLSKDVDVLSSQSFGLFALGQSPILPPTVQAVSLLLQEYKIGARGKNVVVVGAGRLGGLPLTIWLMREKAAVTILQETAKDMTFFTTCADIVISGVGKQQLIKKDMIKRGAVVIDAGTSVEGGKLRGDVDFPNVAKKAGWITPMPGGVGPLTVACLLKNLVVLGQKDRNK